MPTYAWIKDRFVREDGSIPFSLLLNSLTLRGYGVFEGIPVFSKPGIGGAHIFRLDDHIGRMLESARGISMKVELTAGEIRSLLIKSVRKNKFECPHYIHASLFVHRKGITEHPHFLEYPSLPASLMVTVKKFKKSVTNRAASPKKIYVTGFERDRRQGCLKVVGEYYKSIQAQNEAQKMGFDTALYFDRHGSITETAFANIFFICNQSKKKILLTPTLDLPILPGITRDSTIKIAKKVGLVISEEDFSITELASHYSVTEIFITGSSAFIAPVNRLDWNQKEWEGPYIQLLIPSEREGPITRMIRNKYWREFNGTGGMFPEWRTEVKY